LTEILVIDPSEKGVFLFEVEEGRLKKMEKIGVLMERGEE